MMNKRQRKARRHRVVKAWILEASMQDYKCPLDQDCQWMQLSKGTCCLVNPRCYTKLFNRYAS